MPISNEDELYDDVLAGSYKNLDLKWIEESQVLEKQKERIETLTQYKTKLMLISVGLKKEFGRLKYELEEMTKYVCMLKSVTNSLDSILSIGKYATTKIMKGLSYIGPIYPQNYLCSNY